MTRTTKKMLLVIMSMMTIMTASAQHYSHWSMMAKVGTQKVRGGEWNQIYSLAGEYDFSPMWGIGGDFMYILTDRHGSQSFHPKCYIIDVFSSFNMTNILCSRAKKVEVLFDVGVGLGFGGGWGFYKKKNNLAPMIYAGPAVEWNISKHFGLGLDLRFIVSSTNRFMGTFDGKTVTSKAELNGYYDANLYLRYKFAPWRRKQDHVRNIDTQMFRRFY